MEMQGADVVIFKAAEPDKLSGCTFWKSVFLSRMIVRIGVFSTQSEEAFDI
jgi:hypothetical protein